MEQPCNEYVAARLPAWAERFAPRDFVIDTHPGFNSFSLGAMSVTHTTLVPVLLAERELTAFAGLLREFSGYPLASVPYRVPRGRVGEARPSSRRPRATRPRPDPGCPPGGEAGSAGSPLRAGPGRLRPPPLALGSPAHRRRLPGQPAAADRLRAGSAPGRALRAGALPGSRPAGEIGRGRYRARPRPPSWPPCVASFAGLAPKACAPTTPRRESGPRGGSPTPAPAAERRGGGPAAGRNSGRVRGRPAPARPGPGLPAHQPPAQRGPQPALARPGPEGGFYRYAGKGGEERQRALPPPVRLAILIYAEAAGLARKPEEAVFPGRWRDQPVRGSLDDHTATGRRRSAGATWAGLNRLSQGEPRTAGAPGDKPKRQSRGSCLPELAQTLQVP
jgi:hypothetical protein